MFRGRLLHEFLAGIVLLIFKFTGGVIFAWAIQLLVIFYAHRLNDDFVLLECLLFLMLV